LFCFAYLISSQTWSTSTPGPMPTSRDNVGVATYGSRIYVIGGFHYSSPASFGSSNANEASDGTSWYTLANLPTARNELSCAATSLGVIYCFGGSTDCDQPGYTTAVNEAYNISSGTWSTAASMPNATRAMICVYDEIQTIYCLGGLNNTGFCMNTNAVYNTISNSWSTGAPMLTFRSGYDASFYNGNIYVVGGSNSTGYVGLLESYNVNTNTWHTGLAPMITPRVDLAATVVSGMLLALGGYNGSANGGLTTVESYNIGSGVWSAFTSMPTGRDFLEATSLGYILFAIGGQQKDGYSYNVVESYTFPPTTTSLAPSTTTTTTTTTSTKTSITTTTAPSSSTTTESAGSSTTAVNSSNLNLPTIIIAIFVSVFICII